MSSRSARHSCIHQNLDKDSKHAYIPCSINPAGLPRHTMIAGYDLGCSILECWHDLPYSRGGVAGHLPG